VTENNILQLCGAMRNEKYPIITIHSILDRFSEEKKITATMLKKDIAWHIKSSFFT